MRPLKEENMSKCEKCGVPLKGVLSAIPKMVLGVRPSEKNDQICNKCEQKDKEKTYKCHICHRMIHEEHSLEHIKAEEYLISLIKKDHDLWGEKHPSDEECTEYFRQLIVKTEI